MAAGGTSAWMGEGRTIQEQLPREHRGTQGFNYKTLLCGPPCPLWLNFYVFIVQAHHSIGIYGVAFENVQLTDLRESSPLVFVA